MSNSVRKNPVFGFCADSDKPGKRLANRAYRSICRQVLATCDDYDDLVMPHLREVSNVWDFPKDGKTHLFCSRDSELVRKYLRK